MCEYFLVIPIDVPSFKLIEGQLKELQGVVPTPPQAENDKKSLDRIGLRMTFLSVGNSVLFAIAKKRKFKLH